MSSSTKNLPVMGLRGRCLSEFLDWRYTQSYWYFRPSFVNGFNSPPLSCVKKNTVYTFWGSGPQTDKHLPQSPFTGQFF